LQIRELLSALDPINGTLGESILLDFTVPAIEIHLHPAACEQTQSATFVQHGLRQTLRMLPTTVGFKSMPTLHSAAKANKE
jgi:hypothetical protein